jgi:hypothetical protein
MEFLGRYGKTEEPIRLLVNADDSVRLRIAHQIADSFTEFGLPFEVVEATSARFQQEVYNANYDGTMHKTGPEAPEAMEALKDNIWTYGRLVEAVNEHWKNHDVVYGFMPDHGCHQIDKSAGSHGLDMEEDMNVIHFYGAKAKSE